MMKFFHKKTCCTCCENSKKAISLIFAIIVVTVVLIMVAGLNEITLRNLARVSEIGAGMQAQSMANSAFEDALSYISSDCEAGCEVTDGSSVIEEDVIYASYDIEGVSQQNSTEGDGMYYVPIPGRGDAGVDCDPEAYNGADEDDCNWNKIFYGETVEIPLYIDGQTMFGDGSGGDFEIKVRTPNGEEILCADGSNGYCDYDNDLVVMTWQIWGECGGVGCYIEGYPYTLDEDDPFVTPDRYDANPYNSEIYTNLINTQYSVLDTTYFFQGSADGSDVGEALSSSIAEPVLHLAFVQTIMSADNPLPYLEYQIVTDTPISNDRSFISAKGYYVSKGDTYFWTKEGSYSQFTESLVNFVFQN
ncbi:hypothetical protein A2344_01955 [Candidatus Peregrinibacteria bacterium RIFOXYB12_FULL_41_12]|nr:MAG: hypothetical protein A2244_03630 [Candidatus Peregrinibacteria bacterium RIFOXYA2_FULL_41_18]OGJ48792.1 MAG: hypothetical protein A2344_01955 [Candidatus Peregrinibacteria bacterium RIFOXYB12_FULL_41_12]